MLELTPRRATVVTCHATEGCLDAFPEVPGSRAFRVAPDELLLLGEDGAAPDLLERVASHLAELDPDGVAVDRTDGWSVWSVSGEASDEVLARLSVFPVPDRRPAFLQGAVAQVPAKALVAEGAVVLMVPAPVGHHLRARVMEACQDLSPRLLPEESLDLSSWSGVTAGPGARARTREAR